MGGSYMQLYCDVSGDALVGPLDEEQARYWFKCWSLSVDYQTGNSILTKT